MPIVRRPRALCSILVLAFLVAQPSVVVGAPVKVRHGTFEAAEATWFVRRDGDIFMHYVLAFRIEKTVGSARTRLFVDKSKCRVKRTRPKKVASCMLEGRLEKLEVGDFRVQPALSGAALDYGDHRIRWEGAEAPQPDVDPYIDTEAAFADAYLQRLSAARGTLFGRRMPPGGLDHAAVSLGLDAALITSDDELPPRLRFEAELVLPDRPRERGGRRP